MLVTLYGEGGYMPDRPDINFNVIEEYEVPDQENTDTLLSIPQSALSNLNDTLNDPSVNSISKVKNALKEFISEINQ